MSNLITNTIEQQLENDIATQKKLPFNPIKLYYKEDYKITDKIIIYQPVVQDYIDYGEDAINSVIAPFVSNTTGYRVKLWDLGIDWNKMSNMELCAFLIENIDDKACKTIFGDLNIKAFKAFETKENEERHIVLYDKINDIIINEEIYEKMCTYIQYMFNRFPPEEEFTSNKRLKQDLINNDKQKELSKSKELEDSLGSEMLSLISFCLNHPGFKYKKEELKNVGIFEFMDSVQRLNIYESTHALYSGMYSGMCDLSKVDKKLFDFMRDTKTIA